VATLYIRNWPDDVHRRLRVAAAENDETIKDIVLRAVEAELEKLERQNRR
jgi:plasmid stability protein